MSKNRRTKQKNTTHMMCFKKKNKKLLFKITGGIEKSFLRLKSRRNYHYGERVKRKISSQKSTH
ncbi:hypothetical protein XSR1_20223 [Xenorhabdus szentirmaii DSM 16338]|uniref:Uncharacterized protein n=1 Tax=Xenorhabdus szentirmaii DSM 16338 TaxID=1427518 RepID=W1IXT6_9GAMM|nr:hypothetical protein XSR1_20223 [Xenorhabdus szentirmaii DSM 16338]